MNFKGTVEEIMQVFPALGEKQVMFDLDIAQKDFIAETNYLEDYALLADIHSYCAWNLPSDYNGFKGILLYDVNNRPLELGDYQIDFEIEYGKLYAKSTTSTPITKLPDAIIYAYLEYYKKASDVSEITDEYQVEDEHIIGIYSKVYKSYYSRFPVEVMTRTGDIIKTRDFNAVNFWMNEERNYRIKAKRWVNIKNDTSDGSAIQYEAGRWELPKRIRTVTTILTPVGTSYAKFAEFEVTPSAVTQIGDLIGFSSMVATLDYANNKVTFEGDFSVKTYISPNNEDYHINKPDAATREVIWDTGIADTIVVVIYEWS